MVVHGRLDTGFWSLSEKSPCLPLQRGAGTGGEARWYSWLLMLHAPHIFLKGYTVVVAVSVKHGASYKLYS